MKSFRENPDGEENQKLTRENERYIFALKNMNTDKMDVELDAIYNRSLDINEGIDGKDFDRLIEIIKELRIKHPEGYWRFALGEVQANIKNLESQLATTQEENKDWAALAIRSQEELDKLREALGDILNLAECLNSDDPVFGERRNATERIEKARTAISQGKVINKAEGNVEFKWNSCKDCHGQGKIPSDREYKICFACDGNKGEYVIKELETKL